MKTELKIKDHFLSKEHFFVSKCEDGVLKTAPDMDEKTLFKYYDSDEYISHNNRGGGIAFFYKVFSKLMLRVKLRLIKGLIRKDSVIVDFGCGKGDFISHLVNHNYRALGVENNKKAKEICTKKNLEVFNSIEEISDKIALVTFWHSFEHLSSPKEVLKKLFKITNGSSYVVLALPNYNSFDAKFYGAFWAAYDVPRHRFHYSKDGINKVMRAAGFKLVKTKPMLLDAFYISMISEKYKNRKLFFLNGIIIGFLSNLSGFISGNFSSSIFVFKKTI